MTSPLLSYHHHVQQYLVASLADPLISSVAQEGELSTFSPGVSCMCLSPTHLLTFPTPPTDPGILTRIIGATKPNPHRSSCNLSYTFPVLATEPDNTIVGVHRLLSHCQPDAGVSATLDISQILLLLFPELPPWLTVPRAMLQPRNQH